MKYRAQLSSRERVLLALDHQETDRIPFAMVCSGINEPTKSELDHYLRRERNCSLDRLLDSLTDIRNVAPEYKGPPLSAGEDFWSVRRVAVRNTSGGAYDEIDFYPLAEAEDVDDVLRHRWPTTDWFDYSVIPGQIDRVNATGGPYAIMALNCNVFETAWYMRGFENAFMDLASGEELFDLILKKVTDFFYENTRRTLEAAEGKIDLIFTADDIGQQTGLLMSLPMWEKYIKPHHARINKMIHEHGARVMYHTDGAVMDAVPGLIDMGIDILQALQFDATGMDANVLKNQYGGRLCFQGGISVQSTLPFGTPEAVRNEIEERIRVLGRKGGYILGPSHAIQAGTPVENVMALLDAVGTM